MYGDFGVCEERSGCAACGGSFRAGRYGPQVGWEGMRGGKAMLIPSPEAFEQKFMIFQVVK